ncbi:MAG TPA: hypothetical protein DHV03_00845 [Alphaproteobacteria bacterium]|nr:MAG: hypothetical protein DBW67_04570 [SAR116 cluster bacterium]HCY47203.1 hypothetical protein [Alphaproteobacteria bacterium]|tara:strand:- start:245 stop:511 length:267 start_codon:yes stop_codon:yes gene_type:complete
MGRGMIILGVVLLALIGALIYAESEGLEQPAHMNCKESMVEQFFSDKCTPRRGILPYDGGGQPAPPGTAPNNNEPVAPEGLSPRGRDA